MPGMNSVITHPAFIAGFVKEAASRNLHPHQIDHLYGTFLMKKMAEQIKSADLKAMVTKLINAGIPPENIPQFLARERAMAAQTGPEQVGDPSIERFKQLTDLTPATEAQ